MEFFMFVLFCYAIWSIFWKKEDFSQFEKEKQKDKGEVEYEYLEDAIKNNPRTTYRPEELDEYIGQEKAKSLLKQYILGTSKRGKVFPHTLIYGAPGTGKTTLAQIIAKELNQFFINKISTEMNNSEIMLEAIEKADGGVLFLDEIHSIDRTTAESIYTVMEDFHFNGIPVKPFTLIGATTEIGEIIQNRKPFYDRFKILLELEHYNLKELEVIIKNYLYQSFPEEQFHFSKIKQIARNCRLTPRIGIKLSEAMVYYDGNLKEVLKNFNIVKDGYTLSDYKVLDYLDKHKKIGLQALCSYLQTSPKNYLYNIEPYLLTNETIIRAGSGRQITSKGKILTSSLKKGLVNVTSK